MMFIRLFCWVCLLRLLVVFFPRLFYSLTILFFVVIFYHKKTVWKETAQRLVCRLNVDFAHNDASRYLVEAFTLNVTSPFPYTYNGPISMCVCVQWINEKFPSPLTGIPLLLTHPSVRCASSYVGLEYAGRVCLMFIFMYYVYFSSTTQSQSVLFHSKHTYTRTPHQHTWTRSQSQRMFTSNKTALSVHALASHIPYSICIATV